jgi:lysozyme
MAGGNNVVLYVVAGGLFAYGFSRSQAGASIAPATPLAPAPTPPATPASPPADPFQDPARDPLTGPGYATPPHIILQVTPPTTTPSGVAKPWHISPSERDAIKAIELLRLTRYPDGSGYSIGYGHHIWPADNIGTTITAARAEQLFAADIATAERALNQLVTVPLVQSEIDALGDFVFNEGWGTFARSPILARLNAHDYHGAATALAQYHYASGASSASLVERRRIEAQQFEQGVAYG